MSFEQPRATMAVLLARLRRMIGDLEATSADAVWQDTDLQDILDGYALQVDGERLMPRPAYSGGTVVYQTYLSLYGNYEESTGGTAVLYLTGGSGGTVAASGDYTIDTQKGRVEFVADQARALWRLTGSSYDLYGAAAEVLDQWVALAPFECLTDVNGNKYNDTTKAQARAGMADRYRSRARVSVPMVRGDVA